MKHSPQLGRIAQQLQLDENQATSSLSRPGRSPQFALPLNIAFIPTSCNLSSTSSLFFTLEARFLKDGDLQLSSSSSSSSLPRFLEDGDLDTNSKLQRQFKWAGLVERIKVGWPGLHKNLFKVRNFCFVISTLLLH